MPNRKALTPEQAQQVFDQVQRGVPRNEVAKRFRVSAQLVSNVYNGHAYTDVVVRTEGQHPEHCSCCRVGAVRQRNIDAARALVGAVECESCGKRVEKSAGAVMSSHGRVVCEKHSGRRK